MLILQLDMSTKFPFLPLIMVLNIILNGCYMIQTYKRGPRNPFKVKKENFILIENDRMASHCGRWYITFLPILLGQI